MTVETPIPGQGAELDDQDAAMLVAALDGGDEHRAALVLRLCLMRLDPDQAADLARLRRDGPPPVRPF